MSEDGPKGCLMHGVTDMMPQSSAGGEPRKRRRHRKPLPRGPFDRRTRIAKRRAVLERMFTAQAGEVTPALAVKIAAAAELVALAESYRGSFMRGAATVPLDDLVRLERLAVQSVRVLGLDKKPPPGAPSLAAVLRKDWEQRR
jgi:hypothetical protein